MTLFPATVAAIVADARAAVARHAIRRERCTAIAADLLISRDDMIACGDHTLALAATWRARAWCAIADHDPLLAWRARAEAARLIRLSQEVR